MTPAITTVIPTYRRPALLARAIRSVLNQTYPNANVAVFDNASGDETADVVARLAANDRRVTYYCHASNIGGFANFEYAMSHVESPFFSVLSDDDVLFPDFFAIAMEGFSAHPEAVLFAGSTLEFDAAGSLRYVPLSFWPREGMYEPHESVPLMFGNHHPTWTGIVFRRSLIDSIGIIDPGTGPGADFDYVLRASARFPIVISLRPAAAWVFSPDSQTGIETAAIIPCYEQMIRNLEAVETLPDDVKRRAVARMRHQLRDKLLELTVKAQVRGDGPASREAALLLRDRYGAPVLGALLVAMSVLCSWVPALQRLLVWLESERLRMRASASRRRAGAAAADVERYAAYLRI